MKYLDMGAIWHPEIDLKILDQHLELAFKRVCGVVGSKMFTDSDASFTFKEAASNVFTSARDRESGPFFMGLGQGILKEICSWKAKKAVSLKELAAEILGEFYEASQTAFETTRLRLHDQAEIYLTENISGLDQVRRKRILAAADKTFLPPSREEMTKAALPYVHQFMTPATMAGLACGLGIIVLFFTLRHPLVVGIGNLLIGAGVYWYGRDLVCNRAAKLLETLPKNLYDMIRQTLVENHNNYRDMVNAAVTVTRSLSSDSAVKRLH